MRFQPDQISALRSVLDKAAVVAAGLSMDLAEAETMLHRVDGFARGAAARVAGKRFVLSYRLRKRAEKQLTGEEILDAIARGEPVLQVSDSLRLLKSAAGDTSLTAALARSKAAKTLELVWHETTMHYVVAGRLVHDEKMVIDGSTSIPAQKWFKPFSRLPDILTDHMEEAIQHEKLARYWKDKKKRILLATPDRTERIFHGLLYWWLNNFVTDRLRVYAQPTGFGQDSTDITVITILGGAYLIEVKWLGVNEKGTRYGRARINKGLVQVKEYLRKDKSIIEGYLVFYDARDRKAHDSQSKYNHRHRHARCGPPFLLFLESESPSEVAAQLKE